MIQSYLFLTQSYLEIGKLQQEISWQFFVQKKLSFENNLNLETRINSNKNLKNQTETNLETSKPNLETNLDIQNSENPQKSQNKNSLKNKSEMENELKNLQKNPENLQKVWQKFQSLSRIITANFDDKSDARVQIMSFYQNYPEPTLLFLGNLQDYSTALQESLLKFLEEPPTNLFVILFAHNSSQILGTISSRSQKIMVPTKLVFQFLDPVIAAVVKEKLPLPSSICADFVKEKLPVLPDLKKVEREELDLWLWQIEKCLENLWLQEMSKSSSKIIEKVATKLQKTLTARQLNNQNLQKKLALAHLWLN